MSYNIFQISHSIDSYNHDALYEFSMFIHKQFDDIYALHNNAWLVKLPVETNAKDVSKMFENHFKDNMDVLYFISKLSTNKDDYSGWIYSSVWKFINDEYIEH